MRTPAERLETDPYFARLVLMLHAEFEKCDQSGAGLTPTEVRDACSLAWQMYYERHQRELMIIAPRDVQ